MRIDLKKTATGYFAIAFLLTCPLFSSETTAMPARNVATIPFIVGSAPVTTAQTRPVSLDKTPVLAKNSSKAEPAVTAAVVKEQKTDDKKAIGRCWKRLMNMAREIRHAHSNTTK